MSATIPAPPPEVRNAEAAAAVRFICQELLER